MAGSALVGLVANPASALDIRRLVADGSAVTANHKINVLRRVLSGLAGTGVGRVLSMTDFGGISGGLESLARGPDGERWPKLDFVEHPITQSAADTTAAVKAMVENEVDAIVVLGGDGTNKVVADECGDIPVASISTGTNNAFPTSIEPTVVGLATGLVATGRVSREEVTHRCKAMTVSTGDHCTRGLVDVAIIEGDKIGSGAVWDATNIVELFLCFAETQAIGLSSIGAHVQPVGRHDPFGLHIRLGSPSDVRVRVPLAPGLLSDVDIAEVNQLEVGVAVESTATSGVVAVDGERSFRIAADDPATVTLSRDGPVAIDVAKTMDIASRRGVLTEPPTLSPK